MKKQKPWSKRELAYNKQCLRRLARAKPGDSLPADVVERAFLTASYPISVNTPDGGVGIEIVCPAEVAGLIPKRSSRKCK